MYKKIKLSVVLRGSYDYSRGYVYCFCQIFQGLRLFKGLRLFQTLEYICTYFFKDFLNKIYFSYHCAARSSGNKDMKGGFFKQDCSSLLLAVKAPPFKKFCRTNVPMAEFKSFFSLFEQ